MDLRHSADTEAVRDTFDRLLVNECRPDQVRAAEERGFDDSLWKRMLDLGIPTLGVPSELGGGGADMRTLAAICESAGRSLAPAPVVDSLVTGRATARAGVDPAELGDALVVLAVGPAQAGTARWVPSGGVAEWVVGLDDEHLVLVRADQSVPAANLGALPAADVNLRHPSRRVLATGPEASKSFEFAVAEWKSLMASALVGLAGEALRLGVAYVKERKQFGVPIGTFQALAHALADDATAVDGARLLAHEAAWCCDIGSDRFRGLAEMAYLFGGETAQKVSADALHFHGGYGFMLEYDIQLYFRRAKTWSLAAGRPADAYEKLASVLYPIRVSDGL